MDIIHFMGTEHEQALINMVNNQFDNTIINHIQVLFDSAFPKTDIKESGIVLYQILIFIHYHFLFSTTCLLRCHLSESMSSTRSAIDGALIAAQIISDRDLQIAYLNRSHPFDKLVRHYKNIIKNGGNLPHRLIPNLIKQYDMFSSYASHADVNTFVHRSKIDRTDLNHQLTFSYFQFSRDKNERQLHSLMIFQTYVMILDIFSETNLETGIGTPQSWKGQLQNLGSTIELRLKELFKQRSSQTGK